MALGNIVIGSKTYTDAGNGFYINAAAAATNVDNTDRIAVTRAQIQRSRGVNGSELLKQDFHVRRELVEKQASGDMPMMSADLRIQANSFYTSAQVKAFVGELSTAITAAMLDSIRVGLT